VTFDPANWNVLEGTWAGILQQVNEIIVRMEYINGDEWNRLDNVYLSFTPVVIPVQPVICSDFEEGNYDGWSFTGTGSVSNQSSGGNPGRYIRINDATGTSIVNSPPKFLGDWSLLDNHEAEIHADINIISSSGGTYLHDFFIKIEGPGGEATFPIDNSIENALGQWYTFSFPIDEASWTVTSGTWTALLSNMNKLSMVLEYISGNETVGFDNFCISNLPPVTDFVAEKTFVFLGETVQFYDASTSAPQTWSWNFGDTETSTDVNPTHTYTNPGIYTVTLTTTNHFGNSTKTKTDYIEVYPVDQCLKFQDDFDDNSINPLWKTKNGTWSEASGNIRQTSNHYVTNDLLSGCFSITGSPLWENYILSSELMSTDNDYIGLVWNWQDELNMYMFTWNRQGTFSKLFKYVDGNETLLMENTNAYEEDTWYHVDVYSINGTHSVIIDGVEMLSIDDNTYTNGKAGLFCSGNQSSYWDNFKVECPGTSVDLNVFIEGPMNGTEMITSLNTENYLSLSNPYTTSPWNHPGTEGVMSFSSPDIVDWVLVDFRDATSAANALPGTSVVTKAGLLLKDGQIISPYGGLPLYLNVEIFNDLYVVVKHRNHLGILSAGPMMEFGGALSYDFTSSANQAYGTNAQKNLGNGIYGMYAGDVNADGIVDDFDKELAWETDAGKSGYIPSDCNLDGQADNMDKNELWLENLNEFSKIPE